MMRKFLIYVLFIAVSSWVLSSVIAWSFETLFLAKTESQVNYKLSRFYKFNDDVLFLGSSRAEQSFLVDTIFEGITLIIMASLVPGIGFGQNYLRMPLQIINRNLY